MALLSRLIGHLLAATQTPISCPAEPSRRTRRNETSWAAMRKTQFLPLPPRLHIPKSFPPSRCSLSWLRISTRSRHIIGSVSCSPNRS
ncbi:hypothetical protein BDV93DRAFT_370967 [Ceratobasidium sp. AG-I]|nr:hypothetical protein BDV93DRAFT_370967 [Ceratobasidium sp. AG-I]